MRRTAAQIVTMAWLIALTCSPVLGTTWKSEEFKCPVCGTTFEGRVLMSTNTFGGQDRDFCSRAVGAQPLLIVAHCCPNCLFAGYGDGFTGEAKVPEDVAALFRQKAIKPSVPVPEDAGGRLPPDRIYDLIAQRLAKEGQEPASIAHQYLQASHAVRLNVDIKQIIPKQLMQRIEEMEVQAASDGDEPPEDNRALGAVKLADKLSGMEKPSGEQLAFAAYLYRAYGENTHALMTASRLKGLLDKEAAEAIEKALRESIGLERHYQAKAAEHFKAALTKGDTEYRAVLTYLCAELYRRLERWGESVEHFKKVEAMEDAPDRVKQWAREQKERLLATAKALGAVLPAASASPAG